MQHQTHLEIAQQAALAAGEIQRQHYGARLDIHTKSSGIDLVTDVDLACDQVICKLIKACFPESILITEETFQEDSPPASLETAWIIDPLDGTTNFAHSFPHFAVSIAYVENGQPVVGVIYDPSKHELFSAVKNYGAWLSRTDNGAIRLPNHPSDPISPSKTNTAAPFSAASNVIGKPTRLHTSPNLGLARSLLATGFPYNIQTSGHNNLDNLARMLVQCHGVRRPGAAALDLAYVASGRLDGFWELTLSSWDLAAGVLLVEEAGGVCTDLHGQPLNFSNRRIDIIAANSQNLLDEMVNTLNPQTVSTPI